MISTETTTVMVQTDKFEIKIVSAYNLPNKRIQKNNLSRLSIANLLYS